MRARKKKWADSELSENELIFQNMTDCKGKWEQIFGSKKPIALEIGCGMGSFIVEMAKINPDMNFIGLEREKMVIVAGARKIREWNEAVADKAVPCLTCDLQGEKLQRFKEFSAQEITYVKRNCCEASGGATLGNVRFVLGEAATLEEIIAPGEISRIYINFCDPWMRRKKWAKRRLTYRSFLDMYKKLLNVQGELHLKTDNSGLFEFSANELIDCGWKLKNLTLDLHKSHWAEGNVMTEYEAKFASKGMPIYRLEAKVGE